MKLNPTGVKDGFDVVWMQVEVQLAGTCVPVSDLTAVLAKAWRCQPIAAGLECCNAWFEEARALEERDVASIDMIDAPVEVVTNALINAGHIDSSVGRAMRGEPPVVRFEVSKVKADSNDRASPQGLDEAHEEHDVVEERHGCWWLRGLM